MLHRDRHLWAACLVFLAAAGLPAQQPRPLSDRTLEELKARPYLADFDPAIPSQALYAHWPPNELVERPYFLPWSPISFRRAALFARPVVLVMTADWSRASQRVEREVLTHPLVLRELNDNFITIRVNADRRPDLRDRYQTGSWPSIHLLLPTADPMLSQFRSQEERKPIVAGVIDLQRMLFVLREAHQYWQQYRAELLSAGNGWSRTQQPDEPGPGAVSPQVADTLTRVLLGGADRREGGFGPTPRFLNRGFGDFAAVRLDRGNDDLWKHARRTWTRFLESSLHDRRDGGMHRMAVAPGFTNIQYEKPLVVNARLVRDLSFALRREDTPEYRDALQRAADWIVSGLGRSEGGFLHSQIADPTSPDGSGYWRAETRDPAAAPPRQPLVLSGSTALAGAALLRAGVVLSDAALIEAGHAAMRFVRDQAVRPGLGATHVIWPRPSTRPYLESQADVAFAMVDAYQITGDESLLDAAQTIVEFAMLNLKPDDGALQDRLDGPELVGQLRQRARPLLPNVRMARTLIRLDHLGRRPEGRAEARALLEAQAGVLLEVGTFALEAGAAIEELTTEPTRVTVRGSGTDALRHEAARSRKLWTVVGSQAEGARGADIVHGETKQSVTRPEAVRLALDGLVASTD